MNDPLEEKTRDFFYNRLTIFSSMLKDSFVLAVEDKYLILQGRNSKTKSTNNQGR